MSSLRRVWRLALARRLTLSCAVLALSVAAGGLLGGATPVAGAVARQQLRSFQQVGAQPPGTAPQQPPTGCSDPGPALVRHGPRGRRRVALTFDDGPSVFTPRYLRILERMGVVATFFEIGQQVPGHSALLKAILNEGSELGNHTLRHQFRGRGDMAETNRLIDDASGFRPCLFRPPGGALVHGLVGAAHSLGMTTVTWDVDPRDWSRPGTPHIFHTVTGNVRAGSIAIMHDGGGNRSQTLAALPRIISNLKHRGFELVTVTALLGGQFGNALQQPALLSIPTP